MDILIPGLLVGLSLLTIYLLRVSRSRTLKQGPKIEGRLLRIGMPVKASELVEDLIEQIWQKYWVHVKKGAEFDCYDSTRQVIKLEDNTAESYSLVHGFIASHELGHAIIDHKSRLLKLVCDCSAYMMQRKVTPWLAVIFAVCTAAGWTVPANLAFLALGLQLASALVVQVVEHAANWYAIYLIKNSFELEKSWVRGLRNCARYSLATHAHDVARPAALLLILGQLTVWDSSTAMLAPLLALLYWIISLLAVWFIARRNQADDQLVVR